MTHDEMVRGERARQILDDPVLIEALATMEAEIKSAMLVPTACDPALASRLVLRLQALDQFRRMLGQFVTKGTEPPTRRGRIA